MNVESSPGADPMESLSAEMVRALEPFFITPDTEFIVIPLDEGKSTVAKRLPVAFRDDALQREQFVREQKHLEMLEHPGIAAPRLITLPGPKLSKCSLHKSTFR